MTVSSLTAESDPPRVEAWLDGERVPLSPLWLRERCATPDQVDADTGQRLFDPHQLPADLALTEARLDADGRNVWLAFSDGYAAWYERDRLARACHDADGLPAAEPWDAASLTLEQVRFRWADVAQPSALGRAAEAFLRSGFIVLHDVPCEPETILDVARTFGHPRETNFGQYFEVYSRPRSNDLAYRAVALGPHTDNPYREPVPGIQLLHCLVNETTGGLSTLVDSLAVVEALRAEDPEGVELLARVPVRFRFSDAREEIVEERTIIQHDSRGRMTGVHYSPRLDYMPVLDEATTRHFQAARQRLGTLFNDPAFQIAFPLRAGELMMFDNSRVLHGRTAYDPSEGRRHLQGCYIDLDGPRSLYRAARRRGSL